VFMAHPDPAECPLRCNSRSSGVRLHSSSIAVASVTEVGGQQRQLRLDIAFCRCHPQGA